MHSLKRSFIRSESTGLECGGRGAGGAGDFFLLWSTHGKRPPSAQGNVLLGDGVQLAVVVEVAGRRGHSEWCSLRARGKRG